MITELRSLIKSISPSLDLSNDTNIRKLYDNLQILFFNKGMLNSILSGRPVDSENNYLPWYTYPAIDYLNQLNLKNCNVIEFGSGYSTLFWSSKANFVKSIERDKQWYDEITDKINHGNVDLHLISDSDHYFEYIKSLDNEIFDVIIIDGKDRYRTILAMYQKMKNGGMLIFDNADWYPGACSFLRNHGFTQIDFAGFGPINNYTWCTSVFFNGNISIPHKSQLDFIGRREVIKEDDAHC